METLETLVLWIRPWSSAGSRTTSNSSVGILTRYVSGMGYFVSILLQEMCPQKICPQNLTGRSQFDSDHHVNFSTPTSCQSATFVRPLFAFVLCFLRQKSINNAIYAMKAYQSA